MASKLYCSLSKQTHVWARINSNQAQSVPVITTEEEKVWQFIHQGDVYTCRKDEAGKKLDKVAMLICSKAIGHNRISVVADNYIRGL